MDGDMIMAKMEVKGGKKTETINSKKSLDREDRMEFDLSDIAYDQDDIATAAEEIAEHLKWIKYALWYWIIIGWIVLIAGFFGWLMFGF